MALPNQAISAYHEGNDPLGQYTGNPTFPQEDRPRRRGDKPAGNREEKPVQDADDL